MVPIVQIFYNLKIVIMTKNDMLPHTNNSGHNVSYIRVSAHWGTKNEIVAKINLSLDIFDSQSMMCGVLCVLLPAGVVGRS